MLMWCRYCVLPVEGKVMWTNCVLANFPAYLLRDGFSGSHNESIYELLLLMDF